jgi:hypothetical protein
VYEVEIEASFPLRDILGRGRRGGARPLRDHGQISYAGTFEQSPAGLSLEVAGPSVVEWSSSLTLRISVDDQPKERFQLK